MITSADVFTRARDVRDQLRRDPSSLARFAAVYDGPGDAIVALESVADPGADASTAAELAALQAIAFGRATTPDELARAAQARAEIDVRDAAAAATHAAIARAIARFEAERQHSASSATPAAPATRLTEPTDNPDDPDAVSRRATAANRTRTRRVLNAIAFAALGAAVTVAAFLLWNAAQPSTGPDYSTAATDDNLTDVQRWLYDTADIFRGDIDAADAVLDRPQLDDDTVDDLNFEEFTAKSTRRLFGGSETAAFAARATNDDICLIVRFVNDGNYVFSSGCTPAAEFAASGSLTWVTSGNATLAVHWDGKTLRFARGAA